MAQFPRCTVVETFNSAFYFPFLTPKDSSGMITRSESCKFALRENLSCFSRIMISTTPRSLDPHLFYVRLSLPLSLSLHLSVPYSLCSSLPAHTRTVLLLVSFFPLPLREQRRRASPTKAFEVDSFVNRHYYRN